jgi:hypothetical protein
MLGRVLFSAKAEPAITWSGIESRGREISAPVRASEIPFEPSATIVSDPPVTAPRDGAVSLSPYQAIFSGFQAAAEASASMPYQSAGALNCVQVDSK